MGRNEVVRLSKLTRAVNLGWQGETGEVGVMEIILGDWNEENEYRLGVVGCRLQALRFGIRRVGSGLWEPLEEKGLGKMGLPYSKTCRIINSRFKDTRNVSCWRFQNGYPPSGNEPV